MTGTAINYDSGATIWTDGPRAKAINNRVMLGRRGDDIANNQTPAGRWEWVRVRQNATPPTIASVTTLTFDPAAVSRSPVVPRMTANNAPIGYASSASTEFDATFQAWRSFDENPSTDWASRGESANLWLSIQLPQAVTARSTMLVKRQSVESPTNFRIEGRTGVGAWTALTADLAQDIDAAGTAGLIVDFDRAIASYDQYRVFISAGHGPNCGLRSFQIFT